MVTAELAVGVTALALCLGVGLQAVALGVDELRCVDAARVGARAAARGDETGRVLALTRARAPSGSEVTVAVSSGEAVVEVVGSSPSGLLGGLGGIGPPRSRAAVPVEVPAPAG